MNSMYVIVTIPLLLVLAGFNHAHGLSTFGKAQPSNQAPVPAQMPANGKICGNHTECSIIKDTSCVPEPGNPSRKSCLCGDNKAPENGKCAAKAKGPNHMCDDSSPCVDGAECMAMPLKSNQPLGQEPQKVCRCMEGYIELTSMCSGCSQLTALSALIVWKVALSRLIN